MVKGTGHRKSETALAPSRESGEAIAKNSAAQSPNVRRNCAWTEAEHRLFLLGLEEYGRGNWRDIAARYVSTRTPTQVASHAQKYFLREGMPASKKEKRRPSIHDIRSAAEAPVATADERVKLRNSLQIINRESMDSIDTSALEGWVGRQGVVFPPRPFLSFHRPCSRVYHTGFRHNPAFRNYSKNHTLETGSSCEVSTGAADKNTFSSKRESISEEELYLRPWSQSHNESSEGFPELPEDEEVKLMPTVLPDHDRDREPRAAWHSSSLFTPTQLPHNDTSSGSYMSLSETEPSGLRSSSLEIVPPQKGNVLLYGPSIHGAVLPEQAAVHPARTRPQRHSPLQPDMLQRNPMATTSLPRHAPGGKGRVGMPADFPAAYPILRRFSHDTGAPPRDEGLCMDVNGPACLSRPNTSLDYPWGPPGFGCPAPVSLGCQSGPLQSGSAYGSECEQFNTGLAPSHSDFASIPSNPLPAAMHQHAAFVMPPGALDRNPGMDLLGSGSVPVALPPNTLQNVYPQENFGQNGQNVPPLNAHMSQDQLFGTSPADIPFNCARPIEDFRGLALSSSREELLLPSGSEDPLLGSIPDLDQDMI